MNSSGFVRGLFSKNAESDVFIQTVVNTIKQQLAIWDEDAYVELIEREESYTIKCSFDNQAYELVVSKLKVKQLQAKSPYSLDEYIWTHLQERGLVVRFSRGDYLQKIL